MGQGEFFQSPPPLLCTTSLPHTPPNNARQTAGLEELLQVLVLTLQKTNAVIVTPKKIGCRGKKWYVAHQTSFHPKNVW